MRLETFHVSLEPDLLAAYRQLAASRRHKVKVTAEMRLALEEHLKREAPKLWEELQQQRRRESREE